LNPRIIINGDDFGATCAVNQAIIDCLLSGSVSSATMLMNMPGTDEACEFAKKQPKHKIGIHFNLTHGPSLSQISELLVSPNNEFLGFKNLVLTQFISLFNKGYRVKFRKVIRKELGCQIQKFIEKVGRNPTHMDTHLFVQMLPCVLDEIISLGRENNTLKIRWVEDSFWKNPFKNFFLLTKTLSKKKVLIPSLYPLFRQTVLSILLFFCSRLFSAKGKLKNGGLKCPDALYGVVEGMLYFNKETRLEVLCEILDRIPAGIIAEIMVHPGRGEEIFNNRSTNLQIETDALLNTKWQEKIKYWEISDFSLL